MAGQRLCSEHHKTLMLNILNYNAGQHPADFFHLPGEALCPEPSVGMAIPPGFVA
jgi:hypothetical protein